MTTAVTRIKADILPEVFRNPANIGEYGRLSNPDDGSGQQSAMSELGDLMEGSPVSRLAMSITALVDKLSDADPQKIAKPPTWIEKFTGRAVEVHVRYQVARRQLDEMIAEAEGSAQGVRDAIAAIDRLMAAHQGESQQLQDYIQAGREFLEENPDAGKPAQGSIEFDNPRERFARKLANLATLLSSHELSLTQMKLTKAQALDMLDRFQETSRVLVPVWRQHTLALTTTKNMSPAMVEEATRAHDALMKSLAQNTKGLER